MTCMHSALLQKVPSHLTKDDYIQFIFQIVYSLFLSVKKINILISNMIIKCLLMLKDIQLTDLKDQRREITHIHFKRIKWELTDQMTL